jgi:glycosyltransferase involved in cell wall biosynthesis
MPAVSIIIPMCNDEKYIGELLDSILAQTFQDFEVIIIDDCSTDNSLEIVKSYESKFGGRLKLGKTLKNSGGPGEPSNMGIYLSRGEYLLILDNDDTITETALEELYPVAKKFDADVVACEKFYGMPEKHFGDSELKIYRHKKDDFVSKPTLIPFDIYNRVEACRQGKFLWNIWSKLIRRDFLIKNNIRFDQNMIQDMLFTCCLLFTAERYILVPNVINFYRVLDDSLSHKKESPQDHFVRYLRALISGFNFLNKFLSEREFFLQNPQVKYLALEIYFNEVMIYLKDFYVNIPEYAAYDVLRQEFEHGNYTELTAFIFNALNVYRLEFINGRKRIEELEKINKENRAYISELENFIANLLNKE